MQPRGTAGSVSPEIGDGIGLAELVLAVLLERTIEASDGRVARSVSSATVDSAAVDCAGGGKGRDPQTGDLPHAAAFIRDERARKWREHRTGQRLARAFRHPNDSEILALHTLASVVGRQSTGTDRVMVRLIILAAREIWRTVLDFVYPPD